MEKREKDVLKNQSAIATFATREASRLTETRGQSFHLFHQFVVGHSASGENGSIPFWDTRERRVPGSSSVYWALTRQVAHCFEGEKAYRNIRDGWLR